MTIREIHGSIWEFEGDPLVVLLADDEENDYLLVKRTLEAAPGRVDLRWVIDGEEAMDYLLRRGGYADRDLAPRPDDILLDLVMPAKDGLETLKEIKGNRELRGIPLMLLAPSKIEAHEEPWMRLGADSFILKALSLEEIAPKISDLQEYYFGIVRMPDSEDETGFEMGKSRTFDRGAVGFAPIDRGGADRPILQL